jgi:hypothetical protein
MLPFDVLGVIAQVSIDAYRALLSLPRFARASLSSDHQYRYRCCHLVHEINDDYDGTVHQWVLPYGRKLDKICHKLDGPSRYRYDTNGIRIYECWYCFGSYHRNLSSDGKLSPACTSWYDNGRVKMERWYSYGQPHRLDGPASIQYATDGGIYRQKWYVYGHLHRMDGPAIVYETDSELNEYWLNGNRIIKNEYKFIVEGIRRMMQ